MGGENGFISELIKKKQSKRICVYCKETAQIEEGLTGEILRGNHIN